MSATVRATCPGCRQPLRIPAEMLGKPVRCKKCGTVVRSKAPANAGPQPFSLDDPEPEALHPQAVAYNHAAFAPGAVPQYAAQAGHPSAYPYAPPAGYPAPEPLAIDDDLAPFGYKGRGRYRKAGGPGKGVWIAVGLFFTAALVAAGVLLPGYLKKVAVQTPKDHNGGADRKPPVVAGGGNTPSVATGGGQASGGSGGIPVSTAPVPRRMLFIHVGNYLYLNPLTSAAPAGPTYGPDRIRSAAQQLAYEWRVPLAKDNNQLYFLSDNGAADARAPFKGVVGETLAKFLDGSRAQDRVLFYFGGHAVEKDGRAYLVPIEGDPDEVETLIPLDEVYAKVAACPAQQKVVVWDVCRYNPERGRVRPGAEPMSEELEKKLTARAPRRPGRADLLGQAERAGVQQPPLRQRRRGRQQLPGGLVLPGAEEEQRHQEPVAHRPDPRQGLGGDHRQARGRGRRRRPARRGQGPPAADAQALRRAEGRAGGLRPEGGLRPPASSCLCRRRAPRRTRSRR